MVPVIGQLVWTTEPVAVEKNVPTSPAIVPPVHVTVALASTRKFDAADAPMLEGARLGAELPGAVTSLQPAEKRTAVARTPAEPRGRDSARTR